MSSSSAHGAGGLALLEPLQLGGIGTCSNRIFMAPLTRCRTPLDSDHVPGDWMVEYYAQRAGAGLIIAEATMVQEHQSTFWTEPGIYSDEQVAGWRRVTDAVHQRGGKIVLQIWHGGRSCHPLNNKRKIGPIAPSPIQITPLRLRPQFNPTLKPVSYETPREMTQVDIDEAIECFRKGAINAMAAGFDGVEIHAANGYLIDNFLRSSSNKRVDHYGGSLENRARFLTQVVDAVGGAIGYDRTGVRISPLNSHQGMRDDDPIGLTEYVSRLLSGKGIAFLHLMRGDFNSPKEQWVDVITPARRHFDGQQGRGKLVLNMGYSLEEGERTLAGQLRGSQPAPTADAIAFGALYVANPDLVERVKATVGAASGGKKEPQLAGKLLSLAPLNKPDPDTYFTKDVKGYLDYPTLGVRKGKL